MADKIAGSDFERPKAGPEGVEHRDVRNNPLGDAIITFKIKGLQECRPFSFLVYGNCTEITFNKKLSTGYSDFLIINRSPICSYLPVKKTNSSISIRLRVSIPR